VNQELRPPTDVETNTRARTLTRTARPAWTVKRVEPIYHVAESKRASDADFLDLEVRLDLDDVVGRLNECRFRCRSHTNAAR
jgi:hypothetical protein